MMLNPLTRYSYAVGNPESNKGAFDNIPRNAAIPIPNRAGG